MSFSVFVSVWAGLALAAPAPADPLGSLFGKVTATAAAYALTPSAANGYARRVLLPPAVGREPAGVLVTLDGEPFATETFDPPADTDLVPLVVTAQGIEPRIIGCQVGCPLEVDNQLDRALTLLGLPAADAGSQPASLPAAAAAFEPIEAKTKRVIKLGKAGVFVVADAAHPRATITIVVTNNPYLLALDETGEFQFDDLTPGKYTLGIFSLLGAQQVPVEVKSAEKTSVALPLGQRAARQDNNSTGEKEAN